MNKVVRCACGVELRSADEDDLIRDVQAHAQKVHDLTLSEEQVRAMMEIEQEVREKVASALAYPMVLSTLGIIVVWSLLTFVVPTFAQQVHDAQGHMEGMAAVVLSVSNFVRNPLGVLAIFAVVAGLVFSAARAIQRSNKTPTMLVARLPVFGARDGLISVRLIRNQINAACTKTGIPLEPIEKAALDLFDALAQDPGIHLDMDLQAGDIQFCNNYVTLHSRTSYVDFPEAERRRHMIRLWLTMDQRRPLADGFPPQNGYAGLFKVENAPPPAG